MRTFLVIICTLLIVVSTHDPKYTGKVVENPDGTAYAYLIDIFPSSHASFIEVLPDKSLAVAWFSGEGEGKNLCSIG